MYSKWIVATIGLFIVTGAANLSAADFLPLAPGNTWMYRSAATGEAFTIRVGVPVLLHQQVYHSLRGYAKDQLLVRLNEYDNVVYWDEERQQDILLTSFERIRARWEAPARDCVDQAETLESRGVHDGPAGRWSVVEIRYFTFGCADAGALLEQFTENVGLVRRVVSTIAGPRTFDLVYARLGHQIITAGNTGSFSVTTVPSVEEGFWDATLRIEQPFNAALRLHFHSSQEYDLRLRDAEGNILWSWSADKLFAQVERDVVIRGGYSAVVKVPFPPAIPEGVQIYTLEAWITSAARGPRLAATTTAVR
jgi:hypothetical protein